MKHTISLRIALVVSLSLTLLISVFSLSRFMYGQISEEIIANSEKLTAGVTKVHVQAINQYLDSLEDLAFTIQNNALVQEAISSSSELSMLEQIRVNDSLASFLGKLSYSYNGISGIIILSEDKSAYNYARPFGFYEKSLLSPNALHAELSKDRESGYVATFPNDVIKNSSVKNVFCYYQKLYYQGRYGGTLCILVDCNVFREVFEGSLADGEQLLLFHDEAVVYPQNFQQSEITYSVDESGDVSHIQYHGQPYLSVEGTLANGWTVVDLIPTSDIYSATDHILRQLLMALCIAFGLYFLCILFISHYVTKSLQQLCKRISSEENWYQTAPAPFYLTEIAQLNHQFDNMIQKLGGMLDRVKQEQKQLDKMEIDLLQARINPHFLYNTLDAINWMAIDRGDDDISAMSSDLAAMFRYALNNGSEITTVKNELAHLEKYLNIQRYRYCDRFRFTQDVSPDLYGYAFLNIILQPLVENSLLHGLRAAKDTIDIHLSITLQEGIFHVRIEDNGAGCDASLLNDYLASSQKSTKGYGVKNIHQRIQLRFGPDYGVHYCETSVGTIVEITMPCIENE